jgi:hypothetical protein
LGRRTTKLVITQNDAYALKLTATDSYIGNLTITDKSNAASGINGYAGIWIDNGQESIIDNILVDGLGDTYGGTRSFDDTPAAFRVEGVAAFGDWMQLRNLRTRGNATGIALASGTNGWIANSVFGGDNHSVHLVRRQEPVGPSVSWRFFECQFIGGSAGTGALDFSVYIVNDTGSTARGMIRFIGCFLEISAATSATQGFYCDLTGIIFDNMTMGATHIPVGGKALRVGPNGSVTFGPYFGEGFDVVDDVLVDSGGSLDMWQAADWTGP